MYAKNKHIHHAFTLAGMFFFWVCVGLLVPPFWNASTHIHINAPYHFNFSSLLSLAWGNKWWWYGDSLRRLVCLPIACMVSLYISRSLLLGFGPHVFCYYYNIARVFSPYMCVYINVPNVWTREKRQITSKRTSDTYFSVASCGNTNPDTSL